jgi:lipopolysaccharide export system permease protein
VNSLNSNSELVVINTSGASSWVLAKPLLALALICSLFTGLVGHYVSPRSLYTLRLFATQMRADLVSVLVRDGQFITIEDGLMFHVDRREAGGVLSGILISDERDPDRSIILSAAKGFVSRQGEEAFLFLQDGEIQQKTSDRDGLTIIRFESYIFDLATLARKIDVGNLRPKERTTRELLNPDPSDPFYKEKPGLYRAQIHERFSEMLWPFTYVLVMLGFAGFARSNRQGHGSAIGTGMMVVTILRGLAFSAVSASKATAAAIWLIYALPLVGIALGTWLVLLNKPATLSASMQARFDNVSAALRNRLMTAGDQYRMWQRRRAGARA